MVAFKLREAESLPADIGERVDAVNGWMRGVKVMGLTSRNGRRYTREAVKGAIPLLEGARVYINHPEGASNHRKYGERFGRLRNVTQDGAGEAWADLQFNPHHAEAKSFVWYAMNDPKQLGLSINGDGTGQRIGGEKIIEQITAIHSADIVDGPASVGGIFDQEGNMPNPVVDPAAPPPPGSAPPAGAPAAPDAEPKDFRAMLADVAAHAVGDDSLSNDELLARLEKIVEMLREDAGTTKGEEPKTPDEKEKVTEQLRASKDPRVAWAATLVGAQLRTDARIALREQLRTVDKLPDGAITEPFLEQLLDTPAARRAPLIEDRRKVTAHGPRYTPRTPTPTTPAKSPKELAEAIFGPPQTD